MAQEYEFRLRITGPQGPQVFSVPVGATTIGRQPGNDLWLDDPQVSRRHAQLDCTAVECQITDLESSNGTIVNGARLVPHVAVLLPRNAIIKIGAFELAFEQRPVEPPEAKEPPPATKELPEAKAPPEEELVAEPPPPVEPPSPPPLPEPPPPEGDLVPPGLSIHSRRLLSYLPGIYHTDFMARFLGIFESILTPIEWNVENFDLYLDPATVPVDFMPWLVNWFGSIFDPTWSEAQCRTLLAEAQQIYARRGTRWALSRVLEIYTGHLPEIVDADKDLEPFTFTVKLPRRARGLNRELIERIIDANKPAHTTYTLKFQR